MERVNITRTAWKDGYAMGKRYINGKYICNTLELCDRQGGELEKRKESAKTPSF